MTTSSVRRSLLDGTKLATNAYEQMAPPTSARSMSVKLISKGYISHAERASK